MDEQGVQFGLVIDRDGLRLNVAVDGHNGHTKIGVNVDTDNKVEIVFSVEEPANGRVDTDPVALTNDQLIREGQEAGQPVVVVANCIKASRTVEGSDVEMRDGEGDDQDAFNGLCARMHIKRARMRIKRVRTRIKCVRMRIKRVDARMCIKRAHMRIKRVDARMRV
ncbi:hypothetical protein JR316_0009747 [Psilocybe cubensis]|uniref:Uncharacterized protein n=1 Tax=Psilocybe cubensis TaxID=181762 RepID=A0ACB8GQ38_PSICU|nr:hypothetical protein JR316_0009747 [Psilocybe cubensis]KAH9477527.1 hypothetical protein JR316_0009747 [Psilocybe cubensis]